MCYVFRHDNLPRLYFTSSIHSDAGHSCSQEIAAYAAIIGGSLGSSDYPRVTYAKDGHLAHMERLINGLFSRDVFSIPIYSRLPPLDDGRSRDS